MKCEHYYGPPKFFGTLVRETCVRCGCVRQVCNEDSEHYRERMAQRSTAHMRAQQYIKRESVVR